MWSLIAPALAFALLTAHFLRAEAWIAVAVSAGMILLLLVPRPWAAHLARAALAVGALEWARTVIVFASVRISAGIPAGRMVLILATVAVLTLAAILVFRHPALRRFYRLGPLRTGESVRNA
jgi:hypothetical protein